MTPLGGFQLEAKRMLLFGMFALLGATATAGAQQYPLRLPEGSATKPQRATSAKPVVAEPEPDYPSNPLYSPTPIGFGYIPAILMSDGTVWANFGHGYVQVRTACARPGRVIDGRGTTSPRRQDTRDGYCYMRTPQGSLVVTR